MYPIHESPNDYWRFTKFGLKKLFSDGWQVEKMTAETDTQELFAVLLQRVVFQTRLKFDKLLKALLLLTAYLLEKIPNMIKGVFGDIKKDTVESEAFTSAFFAVFKKL